jgi:hypothetical protein
MKIYKKDDNIIFEVPFWTERQNPYMGGEDVGKHPTLIGIISTDEFGNEELGFAKVIDMAYAGKPDQETKIIIHWWEGEKEDFIKLCQELEIDYIEYPICDSCGKAILGSFTFNKKGKLCSECEFKKEE